MRDSIQRFATKTTLTILTVLSTILANAATYYLSPNGSDTSGNGSSSSPWFTINKAWSVAKAGDIIYLKGGTYRYNSTQSLMNNGGSSGNPIKIWAVEGEKPVITPSGEYNGTRGINIDSDYLHIKGLEITGYKQRSSSALYYGIVAENSNHITFEMLSVHDNGFGLSIGSASGDNLVLNSDFYRNSDPLSSFGQNVPWGGADGITIRTSDQSKTNTIRGCRMWWNSDDGVDLFENHGTIIIENSWAFWNGYQPGTFETAGNGDGFKVGITLLDLSSHVRRILRNNLSFENRMIGIDQNNAKCITQMYNNTTYNNANRGTAARSYNFWNGTAAIVAKNNLDFQYTMQPIFNAQAVVSHNTFNKDGSVNTAFSVSSSDFLSLDNTGVDGPRQSDGSLPNLNFLKLAPSSDLINKGTDVGLPYSGSAPDLGAYETGSTTSEPAPAGDTAPPTVSSFSVPSTSNSLEVPVAAFSATDNVGVTAYMINEASAKPSLSNSRWQAQAPTNYLALTPGTKTLYAWTRDAAGNVSAQVSDIVAISVESNGGVTTDLEADISQSFKIDVYPNPCVDNITVRFSETPTEGSQIEIFDAAGRSVVSREISNNEERISLSQQSPGLYMVKTTIGTKETTTKLILK
ncbi:MAG TPA: T9SS type A sorting domain-containing protein [Prolixibacteraceae bacterium]|nr:T9SS type A sorting domain-containing protein [Prolixibacteraceae bacterium]